MEHPIQLSTQLKIYAVHQSNSICRWGDKLERKVKESTNNKKAKEQSKKEEGVIYKIKCKDCHMIYIGETKFTM